MCLVSPLVYALVCCVFLVQAATALYSKNPDKVRYCVKFRPKEGQLVLKITDDSKVRHRSPNPSLRFSLIDR